jgi:hypothetical protein
MRNVNEKKTGNKKTGKGRQKVIKLDGEKKGKEMKGHYKT